MGLWDKSRQIFNCRLFNPDEMPVVFRLAEKAKVDEMWSFVSKKHEPRWLWYVIDHRSGHILAHVFGRHKDAGFLKRKALLGPFGITHYYRRALRVHTHIISRADEHQPGKRNTEQIERKHLTWRTRITRLVRKTICFAQSIPMHNIVIGLCVNRYALGLRV